MIEGVKLATGQAVIHWLYPPPRGGIAVFDNMLWSGTVLNPEDDDAKALRETAELIKNNDRFEPLLLPVRDGIMIYRKKN